MVKEGRCSIGEKLPRRPLHLRADGTELMHSFAPTALARGKPGSRRAPASLTSPVRPGSSVASPGGLGTTSAHHCPGEGERLLIGLCQERAWDGETGLGVFCFAFLPCKGGLHQLPSGAEPTTHASRRAGDLCRHRMAGPAACRCLQQRTDGGRREEKGRNGTASV